MGTSKIDPMQKMMSMFMKNIRGGRGGMFPRGMPRGGRGGMRGGGPPGGFRGGAGGEGYQGGSANKGP